MLQDQTRTFQMQAVHHSTILHWYLQTQLRSQVLTKLQKQECSVHAAVPSSEALWRNVMNSLIVDYLSACQYHYTLSVFQPEAGISGLQALTHTDILQFMQVRPGSPLQTALGTKCTLSTADGEPHACACHIPFMIGAVGLSCSQCCSTGMTLKHCLQHLCIRRCCNWVLSIDADVLCLCALIRRCQ